MRDRPVIVRRGWRRLTAAMGVAAVLSTAACTGGSDSDSDSDTGGGGNGGGGDAAIAIPIVQQPRSLDPAQLDDGQQAYVWNGGIYDTLLFMDNNFQIQPNAAESYEFSEDLMTLTLTLREGMTFSNGNPVTAEAVRATLERTRTTPGTQQAKLQSVESIEAADDRTVVLNLTAPDSAMAVNLTTGAGVIADPSTFDDPDMALDPVGSGAYELSDETVDGSTYVLERREDHWNVDAYPFQTVTVRVIADPTAAFNAMQSGEVNVGNVQPQQVQQIEAAGYEVSDPIPTAVGGLLLLDREGTIQPALADVRVRQAINMAFDREGLVASLLQGAGVPTEQLVNPGGALYVEELEGTYDFDPEAARELLEEAGYPDGFSMTMPSTVVTTRIEPLLTQALGDIGIDVTWEPVPPANLSSSMQSREYPAVMWFQGLNVPELEVQDRFTPDAFLNPFQVEDPRLTELATQLAGETDPDAREELLQEMGRIAVEDAHYAPILYASVFWATQDGIEYLSDGAPIPTVRRFGVSE